MRKLIKEEYNKLNENSSQNFMMNYGSEIKEALKTIKKISKIVNNIAEEDIENVLKPIDNKMKERYDKGNVEWLMSVIWDNRTMSKDLVNQAIENYNSTGTEPQFLLELIDDYYYKVKKI